MEYTDKIKSSLFKNLYTSIYVSYNKAVWDQKTNDIKKQTYLLILALFLFSQSIYAVDVAPGISDREIIESLGACPRIEILLRKI